MMKPKVLANGLIFSNGFRFKGSVVIEDYLITRVDVGYTDISEIPAENYDVVDCEGKMIFPGVIDEHVHFREPGMTEKGDIASESRAAVAGGVTSFFDMPNTSPQTTTIEAWEAKMARAAEVSAANYAFFLGAANGNIDEILSADYTRIPGIKLFMGSSTGGMLVNREDAMRKLFTNFPYVIACHAESEDVIAANRARLLAQYPEGIPVGLHSTLRSREACVEATRKAVNLARETGARLHVMHVTTADELEFFDAGDVALKRITAETCPHYLCFTSDSVAATGGLTKCNPAIKEESDRRALLRAVTEGKIDVIATDHAPHMIASKLGGDALTTASGMPSVQFALPVMLQLTRKGLFTIEDVVEKMSGAPARLYRMSRRGYVRPHYVADLVIIDPDADYTIKREDVLSTCGWSPYEGMRLNFRVEQTWINGQPAYVNGEFTGKQTPLALRFDI